MRYTLSLTGNIILESKGLANAYFGRSKVIRERFEELPIQAHPSTRQIHHEQIASTRNTQRRRQAQAIRIRCCRMHHPVEVAVPNIFKEPLVIRVEGRDETDRFVWQGMPVLRDAKGLFALRFNRDSDLVERFFEPAATASKKLEVMGWTPLRRHRCAKMAWLAKVSNGAAPNCFRQKCRTNTPIRSPIDF